MDPLADEQLDYGDGDCRGNPKVQYHQSGAIPALVEDDMLGDEDEYDDLYNDVNVGESLRQIQSSSVVENSGYQHSRDHVPSSRVKEVAAKDTNNARVANEGGYHPAAIKYPEQKTGLPANPGVSPTVDAAQQVRIPGTAYSSHPGNAGYQGYTAMPQKIAADRMNSSSERFVGEPTSVVNQTTGNSKGVAQMPSNQMNSNVNRPMDNEYLKCSSVENGNTVLFVGELHWWTTDSELESVLIQYGKIKEIKFFDERASGKSKGYCQVEFYEPAAAYACKEGMNGHLFNGRACVVAFATPQTIKQMGSSNTNKNQSQGQTLPQQGRNLVNDGGGRGNGTTYPSGDAGRNFGRGGWGRGSQGPNKGPVGGRGSMGNKSILGNVPGTGGLTYGQGGIAGPAFGGAPGLMHPQGMMGPGFDLAFMGRGAAYGGFSAPAFPGMLLPFHAVNSMGLPEVAPHVNPAFFGRGLGPGGMNMMGNAGMVGVGPHSGMWSETNMGGGWGGEEHGRGMRESSYGGEDNGSEYGYGEASHDKGVRSSAASREKERDKHDRSNNPDKRVREREDRDPKYRDDKDHYHDDGWNRGQSSRSRSRAVEDDHRSQSRDPAYGKRSRRMSSE